LTAFEGVVVITGDTVFEARGDTATLTETLVVARGCSLGTGGFDHSMYTSRMRDLNTTAHNASAANRMKSILRFIVYSIQ
jgi:hypothetical protein